MKKNIFILLTFLFFGLCSSHATNAEAWPNKPVRLVVPFPAAGGADTMARIIAQHFSEDFKQSFYVENRAGAGGLIGAQDVAKSKPDGYTLLLSGYALDVLGLAANVDQSFDPLNKFTQIAYLGGPPAVIIAHPSLGAHSLKDVLAIARKRNTPLPYAGNAIAEIWARRENLPVQRVPYRGAAQGLTDIIAGHVLFGSTAWMTAVPYIRSGAVVPLAVTSRDRIADFPNVPTLRELGYDDLVLTTWYALAGPKNLPNDIVLKLNQSANRTLKEPEVEKRLKIEGVITQAMTPDATRKFVAQEIKAWVPMVRKTMEPSQ